MCFEKRVQRYDFFGLLLIVYGLQGITFNIF